MKCAMQTWWGGHRRWEPCRLAATDGVYCAGHAWANVMPPFWDGGSLGGGSLIHRTAKVPDSPRPLPPKK